MEGGSKKKRRHEKRSAPAKRDSLHLSPSVKVRRNERKKEKGLEGGESGVRNGSGATEMKVKTIVLLKRRNRELNVAEGV